MLLTDDLIREYRALIGRHVHVVMDRPIGSVHPKHPDIVYPINYGYVKDIIGGDGEEQDVYVLGPSVPLETFDGAIIAVVHRYDDNECKWVAAECGAEFSKQQIEAAIKFQEQFHDPIVIV